MDQKSIKDLQGRQTEEDQNNRREAIRKVGKYAAYTAPFTVLAIAKKADAGTARTFSRRGK